MNRDDERRLIVGLVSNRDLVHVREESLRRTLGAVRREQQQRRVMRLMPVLCAPVLLGVGLLLLPGRRSEELHPAAPPGPAITVESRASRATPIEPIDDQQLLALLAGRTVALIGAPGRERLLVFDAPERRP